MHFEVTISLAFAFKVTKVSPMPDRNTCKFQYKIAMLTTRCQEQYKIAIVDH